MAMDKFVEIQKRLKSCKYFMDVKNTMSLARQWYESGDIDHDDYQKLVEESKHYEQVTFPGR